MTTYAKRTAIVVAALMLATSAARAQLENTLIAFVSGRDLNDEIYVVAPDGTGVTNLTQNAARDTDPDWSPDGSRIIFESDRDGQLDIFVMDADGANPQNLTSSASESDSTFDPAWSPDGTLIAFRSHRAPIGLYIMDADGSGATELVSGEGAWAPAWSPDGTLIAYEDGNEIWMVDVDTKATTKLTTNPNAAYAPEWSPDDTLIAFFRADGGVDAVYTVNINTLVETNISQTPSTSASYPDWSPDGSKIVFASGTAGLSDIWTMDAGGLNQALIPAPANSDKYDSRPDWSPVLTPSATITSPVAGDLLPVGTASVEAAVSISRHDPPGSWAWQLGTPFPTSGPAGGNAVAAGTTTATVTGLSDSQTYTLYVALIDGAGNLLEPSVTDSVTFSVDGPPTVSIASPGEGEQFPVGTVSTDLTVNAGNHPAPGHWHWQLDTPFAASGLAGGNEVAAGEPMDTITGLADGTAYTVYVALVDDAHNLLDPSVTASATFTVGSLSDTLTVADKQGGAGTTVTIPVDIYDVGALAVAGVDLIITYDDTILTPTSDAGVTTAVATGPVVPAGWSVEQNVSAPGSLVVAMAHNFAAPLTGGGTLLTVDFEVAAEATANTTTPVGLTGVEINEGAVSVTAVDGTFTVLSIVYGDVTGNGSVGAFDAAWILEYVVNEATQTVIQFPIETTAPVWAPLPLTAEEALEVADVVIADGLITAADASDVLRFRVGLIGSLDPQAGTAPATFAVAPAMRLTASSTSSRPGARITVSLYASGVADLRAGELVLAFDDAILRPVDVSLRHANAHDATGRPLIAQQEGDGHLAVAFASAQSLRASGAILDVTLEASRSVSRPTESVVRASHVRLNRSRVETDFAYAFRIEPYQTRLMANYPNPFNPETWIPFELAEDGQVMVRIYDLAGAIVRTLDLGHRAMGEHADRSRAAYWDGRNEAGEPVASGVYMYELAAGSRHEVRRMAILK